MAIKPRAARLRDPTERLPKSREHHEVGMEGNTLQSAHPQRRESVLVLQAAELTLHCRATTVKIAEALSVAADAREQPSARGDGQDDVLPLHAAHGDDRIASALFALGVDARVAVALVHGARLGTEAASVHRVEERRGIQGLVRSRWLDTPRKRQACRGADTE